MHPQHLQGFTIATSPHREVVTHLFRTRTTQWQNLGEYCRRKEISQSWLTTPDRSWLRELDGTEERCCGYRGSRAQCAKQVWFVAEE